MVEVTDVVDAQLVQAVAMFPPRPDAIITLLASDDFLPGKRLWLGQCKQRNEAGLLLLVLDISNPPKFAYSGAQTLLYSIQVRH